MLNKKLIGTDFSFRETKEAMGYVNKVADIAELERHHPNIYMYDYKNVKVSLLTHAIKGLSENDFIVAAKIDNVRSN